MSRYKFQLDPPPGTKFASAIRWFLAASEARAFHQVSEYIRMTAFPTSTRVSLLAVEEGA